MRRSSTAARATLLTVGLVVVLTGCSAANAMPTAEPTAAPVDIVLEPDAEPDAEVPEADVPIADVAPEAREVNSGDLEQAAGIKMTSDEGKGLDEDDVSETALNGGCLPGYGGGGVCLPPVPPRLAEEHAGHPGMDGPEMAAFYTCSDVRALVPEGLAVADEDYLDLDSNGDGVACGGGDR